MATTAEFIGVYIADIITTATITIIVATIITITAIGETYRVVAISKLSSLQWLTIANNDGERRSVQSVQNPPWESNLRHAVVRTMKMI